MMILPKSLSLPLSFFAVWCNTTIRSVNARRIFTIDPWELPDGSNSISYPQFTAVVGDTVNFNYGPNGVTHDIFKHPGLSCEMRDVIRVKGTDGPGSYTFTFNDASQWGETIFFSCDVASHCELGQHLKVVVFTTQDDLNTVQSGRNPVSDTPPPFIVVDDPATPAPAPAPTSNGTPNYVVNAFECNGSNDKIIRPSNSARLLKGEEIKICFKVSSATKENDVWIKSIKSIEYNKAPYLSSSDAVKQVAVKDGVVSDNSSRIQCSTLGNELCYLTTKLTDDFFNHDGEVQMIGVIALQNGKSNRRRHERRVLVSSLRASTLNTDMTMNGDTTMDSTGVDRSDQSQHSRYLQSSAGFVDVAYNFLVGDNKPDNDPSENLEFDEKEDSFDEEKVFKDHLKKYKWYYIIGFIVLVVSMCCCIVCIIVCCIIPARNKRYYENNQDTTTTTTKTEVVNTTTGEPIYPPEQAQPRTSNRRSAGGAPPQEEEYVEYEYDEEEYEEPPEPPQSARRSTRTYVDLNKM